MNLLHEGVEVNPLLAPIGHRIVEAIHQEALAAPDPAPEIDALRRLGWRQQALEGAAAIHLESEQIGVEACKALPPSSGQHRPHSHGHRAVPYRRRAYLRGDVQFLVGHRWESVGESVFSQIKRRVRYRNPPFGY
jgi:hypothetical protein